MRLIYRPEREPIPRKGARYFNQFRLKPGYNLLEENGEEYFKKFLETDEGKDLLKSTVLGIGDEKEVKTVSKSTEMQVITEDEDDDPKPKRTRNLKHESY